MGFLLYVFVALAGALNAVQSGTNAQLARSLEQPWLAGFVVCLSTTLVFAVGMLVSGQVLPAAGKVGSAPWWAWTGGLCGAVLVIASLFFAQKMGSGFFTGLTITAGVIASILMDHFGLVGFKQHSAGLWRIVGAALMIGGLGLVARF